MRLFAFALCLVLPLGGSAAATTFTMNPIHLFHHRTATDPSSLKMKAQMVPMSFRNKTFHDVKLRAGAEVYLLRARHTIRVTLPAGTTVQRLDEMDSRHDRETVMEVQSSDPDREVEIS